MDSRHGVEYFIDFYGVLGIEKTANQDEIKKAFRKLRSEYHPDHYEKTASEFQNTAKEKSMLLNEVYAVLSDDEKKKTYDEAFARWEGVVSYNGVPIIDITKPFFSSLDLLSPKQNKEIHEEKEKLVSQFSGYEPHTFDLIEKMYHSSEDPSLEIVKAYREQLEKRDRHLFLQEDLAWQSSGFRNQPIESLLSISHVETTSDEIASSRSKVEVSIPQTLLMIKSGEVKLLGVDGDKITKDLSETASTTLVEYQQKAKENFEHTAEKIELLAKERTELAEKYLETITAEYRPAQKIFFPRLALCLEMPDKKVWFCFYLKDTVVTPDDTVSKKELEALEDVTTAKKWIEEGGNILFLSLEESIDPKDQLEKVVLEHFDVVANQP